MVQSRNTVRKNVSRKESTQLIQKPGLLTSTRAIARRAAAPSAAGGAVGGDGLLRRRDEGAHRHEPERGADDRRREEERAPAEAEREHEAAEAARGDVAEQEAQAEPRHDEAVVALLVPAAHELDEAHPPRGLREAVHGPHDDEHGEARGQAEDDVGGDRRGEAEEEHAPPAEPIRGRSERELADRVRERRHERDAPELRLVEVELGLKERDRDAEVRAAEVVGAVAEEQRPERRAAELLGRQGRDDRRETRHASTLARDGTVSRAPRGPRSANRAQTRRSDPRCDDCVGSPCARAGAGHSSAMRIFFSLTLLASSTLLASLARAEPPQPVGGADHATPGVGPTLRMTSETEGVALYRYDPTHDDGDVPHGDLVCAAPCAVTLSALAGAKPYFFGGQGLSSSSRFDLATHGAAVDVRVNAGNRDARTTGIVLTSVGGVVALAAIGLAVYGGELEFPPSNPDHANASNILTAAAVAGGIGGSMLLAGLVTLGAGVTTYEMHDRRLPVTGSRAPAGVHVAGSF